ncbi:hypothetical protein [Jannaschia formosa]|uniref:hypothetical protein n=1 Tax=Jannaschia formosa TaxID=2259592 RepID=UPI000E1C03E4|nr:hypothetical protein [Jannaschia formosa]TFL19701.1 hypothetical protein DR046_04140 [Jannaschia formosa]
MKTITLTAAALLALALPAAAQMAPMSYDTNADGLIGSDEFNAGFTESDTFGTYDSDADGMLNEEEFDAAFTDREGFDEMMGEREFGSFSDYDSDADGFLDEEEYNTAWFNQYDADGSGDIDEAERGMMDADMGEGGVFGDMETDA